MIDKEVVRNPELEESIYEQGWIDASIFADRTDLICDIGSPAYKKVMMVSIDCIVESILGSTIDCQTEPTDSEILDWVVDNQAIVDSFPEGFRVALADDGSYYPGIEGDPREAIKAAMLTEQEPS